MRKILFAKSKHASPAEFILIINDAGTVDFSIRNHIVLNGFGEKVFRALNKRKSVSIQENISSMYELIGRNRQILLKKSKEELFASLAASALHSPPLLREQF